MHTYKHTIQDDILYQGSKFEKGLGIVLKNAWTHVEALQTTDLTALLHHVADVFEFALVENGTVDIIISKYNFQFLQEIICYSYLKNIFEFINELGESRQVGRSEL